MVVTANSPRRCYDQTEELPVAAAHHLLTDRRLLLFHLPSCQCPSHVLLLPLDYPKFQIRKIALVSMQIR